jgi:hypothetical protein
MHSLAYQIVSAPRRTYPLCASNRAKPALADFADKEKRDGELFHISQSREIATYAP